MDDWLVSVVKDGKVTELYYSEELNDLATIRAMHRGCVVETLRLTEVSKTEYSEYVSAGKRKKGRKSSKPWAYRVQCVETGETWPSVIECSKATGIPSWSVYKSIHHGYSAFGRHFITLHIEETVGQAESTETNNCE